MSKLLLNNEDLENVVGGAAVTFGAGGLVVDMTINPDDSLDELFANYEPAIQLIAGEAGLAVCQQTKNTLNKWSNKITKCVLNTQTFAPTYYDANGNAYTQEQVNAWK